MTTVLKLEYGGDLRVATADAGVTLRLSNPSLVLSPVDVGRLIALLARTKEARSARRG